MSTAASSRSASHHLGRARTPSATASSRIQQHQQHQQQQQQQQPPPQPPAGLLSQTPKLDESQFEPCAATASFFLYAQRNTILCLHHDTLAIERRFISHQEDVLWIAVDNCSERGAGRLVVSYDASLTTIVWDLLSGKEVARFASFEEIKVAAWMRNGNIAFGKYFCSFVREREREREGKKARLACARALTLLGQAIHKAMSFYSSHRRLSTSHRGPFTIPLPH